MKTVSFDKPFLIAVILLTVGGFFIFSSASLGLLARDGAEFSSVAFNQAFFGLFLGTIALIINSKIHYRFWRKYALFIFLASIVLTLLVFVPGLGFTHGGAQRWIVIAGFSFQPAELLKIGFIIYFAAWMSGIKEKVTSFSYGLLSFIGITGITGLILLKQPDTGTFIVIFFAGLAMFVVAGALWRHVGLLLLAVFCGVLILSLFRPYIKDRITTFLDPSKDSLGSGYQIQQSLIAIGSGGIGGRGFGQSVQKFNFLPEPIGDSIFAVAGEEFGFIGASSIILLFLFFAFRGLKISIKAPDSFGRLLVVGIVILIISQSFVNIGAILGVLPLSGIPLVFVSHGGTALFMTLAEIGIVLNISKYQKR
ncbi:MAG: cell division protein FtsW [Parcubacteria group bacterium]|nr:cell division protein FtsW [Parcubacteria group bacterium]